jgi:hypothetical protein
MMSTIFIHYNRHSKTAPLLSPIIGARTSPLANDPALWIDC